MGVGGEETLAIIKVGQYGMFVGGAAIAIIKVGQYGMFVGGGGRPWHGGLFFFFINKMDISMGHSLQF